MGTSMSDDGATLGGTRRRAVVRRIMAAIGAVASVPLLAAAIVAPSPAIVAVLSACAVATGALFARSVPRTVLVLRAHRHRRRLRRPIRPSARRALSEFRRQLDSMPETTHPIGL
jgi:hypothetical protein